MCGFCRVGQGALRGWVLSCPLADITLRDIHEALGAPTLLAVGNRVESPGCIVEQAVNHALTDAFQAAEDALLARLGEVTLAQLPAEFTPRRVAGCHLHGDPAHSGGGGAG